MDASPLVAVPTADLPAALPRLWDEGAALLPFPPGLSTAAQGELFARLRPTALWESGATVSYDGRPVGAGVGAVLQTSGTTGEPKGVCLPRAALAAAAAASAKRLGAEPGDRWLACVPLHHIAGFGILVRSLEHGSVPEIHERFDPVAIGASSASFVSLVPTMLQRLLDEGIEVRRFKAILLGGARISPELIERAAEAGAEVVRSYGMTETCGGVVYDGTPLDGVKVDIQQDGRVAIAGPTLMEGYRHDGSGITDGWFVSSDLGLMEGGKLRILGRADDVIVTGGEKVAPARVESWLLEHPAVAQACVIGVPDDRWGERVVAYVVGSGVALDEESLLTHIGDRAEGGHEVPKEVSVVASLPRDAFGNVDRSALRRMTT